MRPRTLKAITLYFFLLFLTATILTGAATLLATHRTIARLVDQRIAGESIEVSGRAYPADPATVVRRIAETIGQRESGDVGFLLRDARGRIIGGNVRMERRLPIGYSTLGPDDAIPGLSHGRALVRDIGNGLTLTTLAETEPIEDYNKARVRIYLFGFGSIILIVIAGITLFSTLIGRRIMAMRRTAEAIIDGDLQRRVPVDGSGSAFDHQATAFNRMLDRIAQLMNEIANVSSDVAHDLRTPLARLRGQLARLHRNAENPAQRAGLETALAQSDALLAMFAAVLRIAEVEGGDRRAGFTTIPLGDFVAETATMMEPVATEDDRELVAGPCAAVTIEGDRQLLSQALINLIENGLRHTPVGSRIEIGVARSGDQAIVTVADNGPGIPADQRAQAMRRFGRLDKARNRSGHGLGLPLVEAVVRLHRGQMALEDAAPGLKVVLTLPATD